MTTHKRLPGARILTVSLALMLLAAFAIGTQASALSNPAGGGQDAVTGASPLPEGERPQLPDGQTPPQLPDVEQPQLRGGFPGMGGSDAAQAFGGRQRLGGQPDIRGFAPGQDAAGSLQQAGAGGKQLHPAVWALIGFGAALLLGGAGFGVAALTKRAKAKRTPVFEGGPVIDVEPIIDAEPVTNADSAGETE